MSGGIHIMSEQLTSEHAMPKRTHAEPLSAERTSSGRAEPIDEEHLPAGHSLDLRDAVAELARRSVPQAPRHDGTRAEQLERAALLRLYQPFMHTSPQHDANAHDPNTQQPSEQQPTQDATCPPLRISLLTQHKKLPLIANALTQFSDGTATPASYSYQNEHLKAQLHTNAKPRSWPWQHSAWQLLDQYDTDQLGTFSGDIARIHSQYDTAILKAKLAATLGRSRIGIGSEGSVAPGAAGAWFPYHTEMVAWWDDALQWAVVGYAHAPAQSRVQIATDMASLQAQWHSHDYQQQALQMKIIDGSNSAAPIAIRKGIRSATELCHAWQQLYQEGYNVEVSYDYRAHCSERRQQVIASAAQDLAMRLSQLCPCCSTPGFTVTDTIKGLPCGACDLPTQQVKTLIYQCQHCGYQQQDSAKAAHADPMHCHFCNP
jgi:hypothetical protein